MRWMIYGANGYTGELVARAAVQQGEQPVLAGRNLEKVNALARELGLESMVFSLDSHEEVVRRLDGIELVLNCAGPFSKTAAAMMEACLWTRTHYLDITGEIAVFELAQTLDARAREAGVVLCPGVGFDVIPTDCVAAALKAALPDASRLALGFDSRSGFSPGTAKTGVEGMAEGGRVRRNGRILKVPLAYTVRRIDFGDGEKSAMTIPWGDVSTAFYTTGIPNIEVFVPASPRLIANARRANLVRPLMKLSWVQERLKARVGKKVVGPDAEARAKLPAYVWGEVRNDCGEIRTARLRTANGYSLTAAGALAVMDFIRRQQPAAGAYTPAKLAGAGLVEQLPGSGKIVIS